MVDLAAFREAVRVHRRGVGRSQQQLAVAIGVNAQVLSRKLHAHPEAVLTSPEVVRIVATLAQWGALADRTEAEALLETGGVAAHAVPASVWDEPPMAALPVRSARARTVAATTPPLALRRPPVPATPLIGRDEERREVAAALESSRLVTLTGVGGTGKTRLALQVATDVDRRFRDGVVFVDLSAVRDPALLCAEIATACGLHPGGTRSAEEIVLEGLAERRQLLVLDNLEQLVDGAPVLGRVLAAAGGVRILATSRVTLRLYGEHVVRVPPLSLRGQDGTARDSEAVRLFLERAEATGRSRVVDQRGAVAAAAVCEALDGLPLAIELAAVQTRHYSPEQLLPLLRSRLAVLGDGPRDVPDRQQTLRATLDWSHDLLSPGGRRLLAALGVLAGRFDAAAAAAVVGTADDAGTGAALAELVEHSLLEVDAGRELPFVAFQTVQEYARTRLAESGEEVATYRRSLRHHLALARAVPATDTAPGRAAAEARLADAAPNVRVALDFVGRHGRLDGECLEEGLLLATAARSLWLRHGSLTEGLRTLDRLLAVEPDGPGPAPDVRIAALLQAAMLLCFTGDYTAALQRAEEGSALAVQHGEHQRLARLHRFTGEAHFYLDRLDLAEDEFRQALRAAERAGDPVGWAEASNMMGQLHRQRGRLDDAARALREGLVRLRRVGDHGRMVSLMHSLSEVERDLGHLDRAAELLRGSLETSFDMGEQRTVACDLEGLAVIAVRRREPAARALSLVGAAQEVRARCGAPLAPREATELAAELAPLEAALPAASREVALAAGRRRPLSEVVAEVLAEASDPSSTHP